MALEVSEICEGLERDIAQYLIQQRSAEQVYHQCTGTIAFLKTKIESLQKEEAAEKLVSVENT